MRVEATSGWETQRERGSCVRPELPETSLARAYSQTEGFQHTQNGVQESVNKSAASAASPDYANFQAVIKSAASAASLRGGRASGRLDHGFFLQLLAALAAKK